MSFFGDFKIDGNQLVAKETGAQIPLNLEFARDAWRIASFVGIVQALRASRKVKGREPRATISFFPKKPRSYYAIWPVCQLADIKIVNDPNEADLHFYFEDKAFLTGPRTSPTFRPTLNLGCFDIRKSVVTRAFEETFGYSLSVDPTRFEGMAVEKSEDNGKHDGRAVTCPIKSPRKGLVYQRLIDNSFDGQEHVDIRTPVVGGRIPFVMLKRRHKDLRFTNENYRVDLVETDTMLSKREQEQIAAFTKAMSLDFGGLDVLRDRNDGRIYVVDVNKTDMGPPSMLSGPNKLRAMRGLAEAFGELVESKLAAQ